MFAQAGVLILIKFAVALNSDGFCTNVETYTERVTYMKSYKVTVEFTKKCRYISYRTCYDYRNETRFQPASYDFPKKRNVKRCCQGYKQEDSKCIPFCSSPCVNGLCTKPETCTCDKGYHKNDKEICMKNECDPDIVDNNDCTNGTCAPNGECVCNEGFARKDSDLESSENFKCVPICSEGCLNGICVSPDKCSCNPQFEAFNSSACTPICQNGCIFGTCTEPDKCTCFSGYQLQNGSAHICNPICSTGCLNGICVNPDVCVCNNGFEVNEESRECEPVCSKGCVNSQCTAPNTCTCDVGYLPSNFTHCVVPCENCTNGYCEEPNVCQCKIDYHIAEGICVENECSSNEMGDSCENGFCSNGTCMCYPGYGKNTSAVCSPICLPQCINGYCSEPGVCQCHNGYDFSLKNVGDVDNCSNCTQLNVCSAVCEDCQNGTCNEGVCMCSEGFEHHSSNEGKCVLTSLSVEAHKEEAQGNLGLIIFLSLLGVVLFGVIGGLAYWGYMAWSLKFHLVTGVAYQKDEANILL